VELKQIINAYASAIKLYALQKKLKDSPCAEFSPI